MGPPLNPNPIIRGSLLELNDVHGPPFSALVSFRSQRGFHSHNCGGHTTHARRQAGLVGVVGSVVALLIGVSLCGG